MYTAIKSYQILIALLKKHDIKHLVLSSGTRNIPLAYSVESDPFFTCYSVVDERSAAFFALGLSQELNEPVAISCTSSTAVCNYLSAVTEAYHQGIPLLIMTGDRNPYFEGQLEEQMIKQYGMFRDVCKKYVQLPKVTNDEDFWYCERLVNEALLELNHHGSGPVHINIPIYNQSWKDKVESLPEVNAIKRMPLNPLDVIWNEKLAELKMMKRILVIYGQQSQLSNKETEYMEIFFKTYNCIIVAEHMANISSVEGIVNPYLISEVLSGNVLQSLIPDLVISVGGNFVSSLKGLLRNNYKKYKHWSINESGMVVDVIKSLTDIFECNSRQFFKYFAENADTAMKNDKSYYNEWTRAIEKITFPEFDFSNVLAIQEFAKKMPDQSILHLSILNSIRITQYFNLPAGVKVYANIGAFGIDGSMSTFLGQAYISNYLAFLVIGDLSFFYDMNSIRIRHIKNNVRILLINNNGGAEFYYNTGKEIDPTIDLHTAARHQTDAKGWAESVGFKYLPARNKEEYLTCLDEFTKTRCEKPMLLEVFTDMEKDANIIHMFYDSNREISTKAFKHIKNTAKNILGSDAYDKLKNLIKH